MKELDNKIKFYAKELKDKSKELKTLEDEKNKLIEKLLSVDENNDEVYIENKIVQNVQAFQNLLEESAKLNKEVKQLLNKLKG